MKCPLCNQGEIKKSQLVDRPARRQKARELRKLGFTFHEIMRALGYKSPRSVTLALQRKD